MWKLIWTTEGGSQGTATHQVGVLLLVHFAVVHTQRLVSCSHAATIHKKLTYRSWCAEFFRVSARPAAQTAPESSTPIAARKDLRLVCESELQTEK